jgi:hypothetical protein
MSLIRNSKEVVRAIDFTGVQHGAVHPSDIDAVLEFDNDILILIEVKKRGNEIPLGQKLLLERISLSWRTKKSVVLKVEYEDIYPIDENIPLEACFVTEYFHRCRWTKTKNPYKLISFLNYLGDRWENKKCRF